MSKLHTPLLSILLLALTACQPCTDGQYLIYKTDVRSSDGFSNAGIGTDEVEAKVANQFKGKKFDLQFKSKYVVLREDGEDMILNNTSDDAKDPRYELTYTKNKEKVEMTLYGKPEDESKDIILLMAIQGQLTDTVGQTIDSRCVVKCHLTKSDN